MIRRAVRRSSNISSVGWERGPVPWVGTMEVEFKSGAVYRYPGVDPVTAMMVLVGGFNGSPGSTFHRLIRRAGYPYQRIT